MKMFCPLCGRTRGYNPDVIGLNPKVCPVCVMHLESGRGRTRSSLPVAALRAQGLIYVMN